MFKKVLKFSFVLAILVLILGACSLPGLKKSPSENTTKDALENEFSEEDGDNNFESANTKRLMKFSNYDDLKKFLQDNSFNQNMTSVVDSQDSFGNSLAKIETDIYLNNINEGDLFQVDGKYAYTLVRDELKISEANFSDSGRILSSIKFSSRPQGFLISGTKLLVFGLDQKITENTDYQLFRRRNSYTFLQVFDLTDISKPELINNLSIEGNYSTLRLVGDFVYLLTTLNSSYVEGEILTPRVFKEGKLLANTCSEKTDCFAPDVYYFDVPYNNLEFANITALNIKDNSQPLKGQSYLLDSAQLLYFSSSNLYITYTEQIDERILEQGVRSEIVLPKLSSEERAKVVAISKAPSYVLTPSEKKIKIAVLLDFYLNSLTAEEHKTIETEVETALKEKMSLQAAALEKTFIYKIGIRGEKLEYRGVGEVGGRILGEHSLNESDSYLRVATKRSDLWARLSGHDKKSYSNVYILNNELKLISRLENLGVDEIVSAARFIGNRLYLLTAKAGDPLYVVDLTDPLKPAILGAIKVPAYVKNLYPADANGTRLFSLGRDNETKNGSQGLKLAFFDFNDLKTPKELDSYIIGDASSDSIALVDNKALFYSPSKNILSVPAVLRNNGEIAFAGALLFQINSDRLVLRGQVDHAIKGHSASPDFWNSYNYYDNTVKRGFFFGNNFYTFSNLFLKINNLTDFTSLGSLTLMPEIVDSLTENEEANDIVPGGGFLNETESPYLDNINGEVLSETGLEENLLGEENSNLGEVSSSLSEDVPSVLEETIPEENNTLSENAVLETE